MKTITDGIERLRKEIDAGDARTMSLFGVSTERRLADLSRQIALDDSVIYIERTIEALAHLIDLFQKRSPRWLTMLSGFLSILPFKTRDQRYRDLALEVQECASILRSRLLLIEDWSSKLDQILQEIDMHVEAATGHELSVPGSHHAVLLQERVSSLQLSLKVSNLVSQGLVQSRFSYEQLVHQLNLLLGPSTSAWHSSRSKHMELQTTVEKAKNLASICIDAESTLQSLSKSMPLYGSGKISLSE